MKTLLRSLPILALAVVSLGCSGGAPPAEKPTGTIGADATDLSSAKPTSANDKFNRFQAKD